MTELSEYLGPAIKLTEPIHRGETTIDSLLLRRPNGLSIGALSMLELARMDGDTITSLLPRISEPTITDIEAIGMGGGDLFKIGRRVSDFLLYPENFTASPAT